MFYIIAYNKALYGMARMFGVIVHEKSMVVRHLLIDKR